jgi:hypothetical protein
MAEINLTAPLLSPDDSDEVPAKPGRGPESCVIAWPSRVAPARPAVKYSTGIEKIDSMLQEVHSPLRFVLFEFNTEHASALQCNYK